jgi:hypothetical protein
MALAIAALGLAAVPCYFGIDLYRGKRLVQELCAKDGGLKIYETIDAKGFLDETVANALYCFECFERLAKHQFEYIDVHVAGDSATAPPQAVQPGYYRLSLAPRGDARCNVWSKNVNLGEWDRLQSVVGISTQQCVAVNTLSSVPDEAILTEVREKVANEHGVDVRVDHWAVRYSSTGRTLAEYRNYLFYSHWDRIFNFAGGDVPEPATACDGAGAYSKALSMLRERSLGSPADSTPKSNY